MRFVVEALVEESDGLVPVHGEVRPARLFPNDDECLEFGFHFAAGLLQQFVSLDGEAFTDDADGVASALGVVFKGHRRSEECDDGVAFVLVERTLVPKERIGHGGEVFVQKFHEAARVANMP